MMQEQAGAAVDAISAAGLGLLLRDCLIVWGVRGQISASGDGIAIDTPDGPFLMRRAPAALLPVRWFLQTPTRAAVGRPPRAASSIGAALSALRNALGVDGGAWLRIGPQ